MKILIHKIDHVELKWTLYRQGSHASWKILESHGFFSLKFQDLESPGK